MRKGLASRSHLHGLNQTILSSAWQLTTRREAEAEKVAPGHDAGRLG
jgi:hypothetical protein